MMTSNPYIRSVLYFVGFYMLSVILGAVLTYILKDFLFINPNLNGVINIISYIIILILLILIKKNKSKRIEKFEKKYLLISILFPLFFILTLDPIYNIDYIKGENLIINDVNVDFFNVVLLIKIIQLLILTPFLEEFFFRRILIENFDKKNNKIKVILFTSLLFALAHTNPFSLNFYQIAGAFVLGLLTGLIYFKANFIYCVLAHLIYNMVIMLTSGKFYWTIIEELSFGLTYWFLWFISFIGFLFVLLFMLKKIRKLEKC